MEQNCDNCLLSFGIIMLAFFISSGMAVAFVGAACLVDGDCTYVMMVVGVETVLGLLCVSWLIFSYRVQSEGLCETYPCKEILCV